MLKSGKSQSVILRVSLMLASLVSLAMLTMFSSVYISDQAEHDTFMVGLSTDLRMQSFQLVTAIALNQQEPNSSQQQQISEKIAHFEQTLNRNHLGLDQNQEEHSQFNQHYHQIVSQWKTVIKPALQSSDNLATLVTKTTPFVEQINTLVKQYQAHAEREIALIRIVQLVALFLTLLLVVISIKSLQDNIAAPLKELNIMADNIGRGNFTHVIKTEREDELGHLAQSFNHTCQAVSQMYGNLENRVRNKTAQLQRSNNSIQLLYDTAQKVTQAELKSADFEDIVVRLSNITKIDDIDLCLMTANGEQPYQHAISDQHKILPSKCHEGDCRSCVVETTECATQDQFKFPLISEDNNFGVIVCNLPANKKLETWQQQIIHSVADQIAVALSLKNQTDQDRRIALMDERATIARELHDSLAQSLSYLKIQVTRLQKGYKKQIDQQQIEEIVAELKEGLSSAYRQLRELLTTFRLKIDTEGLHQALQETINQHQERSEMDISLNFEIANIPLTPNEEIHLLQIIREATQNAVHHSKGDKVSISLEPDSEQKIQLKVCDNGIGIPDDPQKLNHYGLVIMQERSRHLSGDLSIANQAQGGVCVHFSFEPEYLS